MHLLNAIVLYNTKIELYSKEDFKKDTRILGCNGECEKTIELNYKCMKWPPHGDGKKWCHPK